MTARKAVTPTVTIVVVPTGDTPDGFEAMSVDERRAASRGAWETFPLRSGRLLDTFLMKATGVDLGVLRCEDRKREGQVLQTSLWPRSTIVEVIRDLAGLVEKRPDDTAKALRKHGGDVATLARVTRALKSGAWPDAGDPAVEAAAFTHQLLGYARLAKAEKMGLCWEFRGDVVV